MSEQPKEIFYLFILFITVSNVIWSTRIALEFKLTFTFLLFCMFLVFGQVFIWLDSLKVKNP